jgi:L-ascorbate metabolism protein UlaG (beta-lactamase superfamily)
VTLTFRWLGAAGLVISAGGKVLAIDPFFTRPSLFKLLRPIKPDPAFARRYLPKCDYVLVTHAHYDHLLDVPEVLRLSGATAYGSPNTCQLLSSVGIPDSQVRAIGVGDRFALDPFSVEVIQGQHSWIPLGQLLNGSLPTHIQPPLHAWDYRMDRCLGFSIDVQGIRLLICAAEPRPAEVLFMVAQEPTQYYLRMFKGVKPKTFVPIHWDNYTRALELPLRKLIRPGRISLRRLVGLAQQTVPGCQVILPEVCREYPVQPSLGSSKGH